MSKRKSDQLQGGWKCTKDFTRKKRLQIALQKELRHCSQYENRQVADK
jgi:hypothetical protein